MAANTVPGIARVEEALDRISHQEPTFSMRADIFNKHGNAKAYTHNNANNNLIQQAKETGWVPLHNSDNANNAEETWATHLALQDFGVGVGHVLYDQMLQKFAPRNHAALSREGLVREFDLQLHTSSISRLHHKDLISMAILTDITRKYFEDHGEFQMIVKEARMRNAVRADIRDKKPKRPHPAENDRERAKARRVAGVSMSSNPPQGPIAPPSSTSGTTHAATTSQYPLDTRNSVHNQYESFDDDFDDVDEYGRPY